MFFTPEFTLLPVTNLKTSFLLDKDNEKERQKEGVSPNI
jgi:hypothetical protein